MPQQFIHHRDDTGSVLCDGSFQLSYRQLRAAVDDAGEWLGANDVHRQDIVAVVCDNRLLTMLLVLHLLQTDRAVLLLPAPDSRSDAQAASLQLPAFCRWAISSDTGGNSAADFNALRLAPCKRWNGARCGPSALVYLQTSGSTGAARTVAHTHQRLRRNALACVRRFELCGADRVALAVPIAHMYGLGAGLLPAMLAGASVDLQPRADALKFLAREPLFNPSVAYLSPGLCAGLSRLRRTERRYRLTVSAGDRLPPTVRDAHIERCGRLISLYGSTELGAVAAGEIGPLNQAHLANQPTCSDAGEPISAQACDGLIGPPMEGVKLKLAPEDSERPAQAGELLVRHRNGSLGYVGADGQPEAPRASDAWHRTGDIARINASGALQIVGRCDHRVKRDGRWVAFAQVEHALEAIEGVRRALVVAGPPGARGMQLIAGYTAGNTPTDVAALRERCRGALPVYAIPDHFVQVARLPMLPGGKPDRRALLHAALGDVSSHRMAGGGE